MSVPCQRAKGDNSSPSGWRARPEPTLAQNRAADDDLGMEPEELISRSEVTGILFTFADISANVERILRLLEDDDGEEEVPEENS